MPMSMPRRRPLPGLECRKNMRLYFKLGGGDLPACPVYVDIFSIFCTVKCVRVFLLLSPSVVFSHIPSSPSLLLLLLLLLFVLVSPVHQRKRKADGGFAVPSSKSRSAEAQAHQHPSARGSSSSHGRGGGCAAVASSSSCAQQHHEDEEGGGGTGASCRRGGGGGSSLRERSSREASRKIGVGIGREALERLKRCNVPPSAVSEHDVDDRDDPVSCAEYVVDMYKRFKELEVRVLRSEAFQQQ